MIATDTATKNIANDIKSFNIVFAHFFFDETDAFPLEQRLHYLEVSRNISFNVLISRANVNGIIFIKGIQT